MRSRASPRSSVHAARDGRPRRARPEPLPARRSSTWASSTTERRSARPTRRPTSCSIRASPTTCRTRSWRAWLIGAGRRASRRRRPGRGRAPRERLPGGCASPESIADGVLTLLGSRSLVRKLGDGGAGTIAARFTYAGAGRCVRRPLRGRSLQRDDQNLSTRLARVLGLLIRRLPLSVRQKLHAASQVVRRPASLGDALLVAATGAASPRSTPSSADRPARPAARARRQPQRLAVSAEARGHAPRRRSSSRARPDVLPARSVAASRPATTRRSASKAVETRGLRAIGARARGPCEEPRPPSRAT